MSESISCFSVYSLNCNGPLLHSMTTDYFNKILTLVLSVIIELGSSFDIEIRRTLLLASSLCKNDIYENYSL